MFVVKSIVILINGHGYGHISWCLLVLVGADGAGDQGFTGQGQTEVPHTPRILQGRKQETTGWHGIQL